MILLDVISVIQVDKGTFEVQVSILPMGADEPVPVEPIQQ